MSNLRMTSNPKDIEFVLNHPDIVSIAEDGTSITLENISNSLNNFLYFKLMEGDKIAGLFMFHEEDENTLEVHINILNEYRKTLAMSAAKEMANVIFDKTSYSKLTAYVPVLYPNVLKFAGHVGFKMLHMIEEGYKKNDVKYDVVKLILEK